MYLFLRFFRPFVDPFHGHIISGDLNLISDPSLRRLFSYGTKFRPLYFIKKQIYLQKIFFFINKYVVKHSQRFGVPISAFNHWLISVKESINFHLNRSIPKSSYYLRKNIVAPLSEIQKFFIITTVDKASNNYGFICKKLYASLILSEINNLTFNLISVPSEKQLVDRAITFSSKHGFPIHPSHFKLPFMFGIPKFHKSPVKCRFISSSVATAYKTLAIIINHLLDQLLGYIVSSNPSFNFIISNSKNVISSLKGVSIQSLISYDFTTLYTNIDLDLLHNSIKNLIFTFWPLDHRFNYKNRYFTHSDFLDMLQFSLSNNYIKIGNNIHRQVIGIPMGASYSVNLANLFLFYYEYSFLSNFHSPHLFKYTFRYIDDLLSVNNPEIQNSISDIYPSSLTLELSNSPPFNSVNYLDLHISLNSSMKPIFSIFDKRRLYSFKILGFPHTSSNIPEQIIHNTFSGQILRFFGICSDNIENLFFNMDYLIDRFRNNGIELITLLDLLRKLAFRNPPLRNHIWSFIRRFHPTPT